MKKIRQKGKSMSVSKSQKPWNTHKNPLPLTLINSDLAPFECTDQTMDEEFTY